MYLKGLGEPKNLSEAAKWLQKAADGGHSGSQYLLGRLYQLGQGVTKSTPEAVRLYRLAAEKGNDDAELLLGVLYASGDGVDKDFSQAAEWYLRAARQDNAEAQFRLSALLYNGWGVAKDLADASEWLQRAARSGHEGAIEALCRVTIVDGRSADANIFVRLYVAAAASHQKPYLLLCLPPSSELPPIVSELKQGFSTVQNCGLHISLGSCDKAEAGFFVFNGRLLDYSASPQEILPQRLLKADIATMRDLPNLQAVLPSVDGLDPKIHAKAMAMLKYYIRQLDKDIQYWQSEANRYNEHIEALETHIKALESRDGRPQK